MKTAHVCFLWHMHQPYYTDPVSGSASMPWVRLHASKAYFDMAYVLERFPAARVTFNFTPSLLLQLQELTSGTVRDLFLESAQRPAADLDPAERAFIVRHFFAANWATMVRPYPRYHELLAKRGTDLRRDELDQVARRFSVQEMLDLQVWHNLAWFGYGSVARYPRLAALRTKDRGFTEEDKHELFLIQRQVMSDVVPMYRRLAEAGQIELTTTPFYHPILPLVIDTDFARRCRPDSALPPRVQAPADAAAQLQLAVAQHRTLFGRPPDGLWPSEGSVCPEMIPLMKQAGLKWMATDEGVLARSLSYWDRSADLYRAYLAGEPDQDVAMVFRDRELSDAIGFVYSKSMPESAAEDMVRRIVGIVQHARAEAIQIPIILDGENPWEHYYDGGEGFLTQLYGQLARGTLNSPGVQISAETISRSLAAFPPSSRLPRLHSGSWINADFKIWLGHPEDNRGWELLGETRARLVDLTPHLSPEQAKAAWGELYAAEGSDWFWWYGDDFETDYKMEFDRLFRAHLRNVFLKAGASPPATLDDPIVAASSGAAENIRLPVSLLSPTIDGAVSNFFEWHGAGMIDPSPPLGAMWKSSRLFSYIGFGYSLDALFLRLDPDETAAVPADAQVELQLASAANRYRIVFSLASPQREGFSLQADGRTADPARYGTICRRKILELAVPFKDLGLHPGQEFKMNIVVMQHGQEIERYPKHRPVVLRVPDETYEATMWRV